MDPDHQQKYSSNDAHLSPTRDAETLSAGSTARNESTARTMDVHNGLEKDFSHPNGYSNGYPGHLNLDASVDSNTALHHIRTAGSISISPELFEKLYLSPPNKVKGELRKTFGNPTPIAIIGFLLSLFPLSMTLMGWRGAGGSGAANIGWYYFAGGLLMVLGGIGEWILGNTFPFVVFCSFGAFWLGFGATLQPFYNAYGAYANPSVQGSTGLESVGFNVGIAYFQIGMGIMCLVFLVCSIRTNLVFFMIFFSLVPSFGLLAGSYFQAANGRASLAKKLAEAGGAFGFVACLFGWYIFSAIMLATVDFPFNLPIVDLSSVVKGASEKRKVDHVE
ncbi:GPR1/FUN34/yaaH family-domain-containing protein [Bipolaris maydis]|nr:GPR1/FUN34/yaaH family-domain-containing protein [Bipolaris maydis]KAJ6195175.1 GPR1/FUN34/yaaH family-domain-containing protein [Bipolaris maydis]KAJ6278506.1 GPR1/FUN34/yaaH family-domain-containing protein [Bipolaris maydis]